LMHIHILSSIYIYIYIPFWCKMLMRMRNRPWWEPIRILLLPARALLYSKKSFRVKLLMWASSTQLPRGRRRGLPCVCVSLQAATTTGEAIEIGEWGEGDVERCHVGTASSLAGRWPGRFFRAHRLALRRGFRL
jgi:hypothetical protein